MVLKQGYLRLTLIVVTSFLGVFLLATSLPLSYLSVDNQPIGTAIKVNRVSLSKPGFVVIQSIDPVTNLPDNFRFLNVPNYLPKGVYKDIAFFMGNTQGDLHNKVAVTLYRDTNGNGYFDFESDLGTEFDRPVINLVTRKVVRRIITLK